MFYGCHAELIQIQNVLKALEFSIKQVQHQMSLALSESIINHVHIKQVNCTVKVRVSSKDAVLQSDSNRQKSYWQNRYVER